MQRVAIVTGAVRGIGRAIAHELARDGFAIVVNYRGDADMATGLCDELGAAGA
ncbi:MAG TPA: SDR family NAD(P)-dependent oxidoreductase, partial [Thermomicrobiales bacterium]|nr:SDR family NAD(P)-dependent oxidoreductase [Thermomicrobiales bacterium]